MPRPLRIKDPGAIDHAMHRGDRPEAISASRSQSQGSARQEAKAGTPPGYSSDGSGDLRRRTYSECGAGKTTRS